LGVSFQHRAGAPRLIDWTGERCVPWAPDVQVVYEHLHRYMWAARLLGGRRVLDLGSGEGFGAAILAESASHVVGVDIDARTVEHSRLNYATANLEFQTGSALDLSSYDAGSFDAVVAFEIIEHVRDQERVLTEIGRVLADDGILVMSTPDRRLYSEASGNHNPFHEHELGLEEFGELLEVHFPHVAIWGQRTITGSHINYHGAHAAGGEVASGGADGLSGSAANFYVERSGDEWRVAGDPAALYCVAVASKLPIPKLASSTLADCDLGLLREKERGVAVASQRAEDASQAVAAMTLRAQQLEGLLEEQQAEYGRALRDQDIRLQGELGQRSRDIVQRQDDIVELRGRIAGLNEALRGLEQDLAAARQLNLRTEESVTWQTFQKLRARLYGAVGESSLLGRLLSLSLRMMGRAVIKRPPPPPPTTDTDDDPSIEPILLPEYENPKVSLVIPLYAHAELTRACLESIREQTAHVSYEVILVDDEADEDTKRLLDAVRGATIVRNESNLGYLRSVNRGASAARGRWLVLFNNDTEVTRGWLVAMLGCAESADDVGVVTPKFLYPDGSLNEAGAIVWRDGTGVNYGRGDVPSHFQYEYRRETDYGSAAALMVDAELWKEIGGFDERYVPMYYEDADLCFAAREHGRRVLYEPEAVVVHVEGATAGNDVEAGHKRFQEQNRSKFVAKWRRQLESEHLRSALPNVRVAANRHRGPHVLVVDFRVPTWNHDAGSLRMLSIIQALLRLGARVTLMPDNFVPLQPYTRRLQQMGVEVLYGELDVNAELATIGPKLSVVLLSRPHVASQWLDVVREFAPSATVVYDTVDLHWLREARRSAFHRASTGALAAAGNGTSDTLGPKAEALRELELAMVRATDMTLVVSDVERAHVEHDVPGTNVLVVPTVHDVEPFVAGPEGRAGVLFVGGFEHPPNTGAAVSLVKEIMPAVWRVLGDVPVTIVGSNPPPEVRALAGPLVDVTGWIEDLAPLLESARLMAAPLHYGAGLKGKVTQALAVGLPVVTTAIGAEGLKDPDGCLLVAEDPRDLAALVVRLYRDDELWRRLSRSGQALIAEHCSTEVVTERLSGLIARAPRSVAANVES
jgi:GT2 family glycosyltransferase/SAM-dependent methyltransferase/glycosyltransferase involved in cell wall biosynthesis